MRSVREAFLASPFLDGAIALLLAVLLWFYVGGQRSEERTFFVAVEVGVQGRGLSYRVTPPQVAVTIRGPVHLLEGTDPERDLACRLSIASENAGSYSRPVPLQSIEGEPLGTEVLRVEPTEVKIEVALERRVERSVRLEVLGDADTRLERFRTEPESVAVHGTGEALSNLRFIPTERVAPERLMPGARLALVAPPGVRLDPSEVTLVEKGGSSGARR